MSIIGLCFSVQLSTHHFVIIHIFIVYIFILIAISIAGNEGTVIAGISVQLNCSSQEPHIMSIVWISPSTGSILAVTHNISSLVLTVDTSSVVKRERFTCRIVTYSEHQWEKEITVYVKGSLILLYNDCVWTKDKRHYNSGTPL